MQYLENPMFFNDCCGKSKKTQCFLLLMLCISGMTSCGICSTSRKSKKTKRPENKKNLKSYAEENVFDNLLQNESTHVSRNESSESEEWQRVIHLLPLKFYGSLKIYMQTPHLS